VQERVCRNLCRNDSPCRYADEETLRC